LGRPHGPGRHLHRSSLRVPNSAESGNDASESSTPTGRGFRKDMIDVLYRREAAWVCREPDGTPRVGDPRPAVLLPGSFNPLHLGHTTLADIAAKRLGSPVAFELSIANVDKPELSA